MLESTVESPTGSGEFRVVELKPYLLPVRTGWKYSPAMRWAIHIGLTAATVVMLLVPGWRFLRDPGLLAPTRDPAWYTWRTQVLLEAQPSTLFDKEGPFGMLSGGYRITSPTVGALLSSVADMHTYRFTVLLAVGLPVLSSLALAGFAFRHRPGALAFLLTLFASVPLFLTVPFIGYIDNLMSLFFLAAALPFLQGARTSWGARSALAMFLFLATLTHFVTTALFVLALLAGAAFRLAGSKFSLRKTLAADGPMLAAAGAGIAAGFLFWQAGSWGSGSPISEAVLTQPYTAEFFRGRLRHWIRSLHPNVTVPLAALGASWVLWQVLRRRPIDRHSEMSILWALPLAGVFGFALGYAYPYYRFINLTLAPMLLVALGVWVLTRVFRWAGGRLGGPWRLLEAIGIASALLILAVFYVRPGLRTWNRQGPWISDSLRVDLAAARAYAAHEPERPLVFLLHPRAELMRAWGLAKQFSNMALAGVDGRDAARTYFFVGRPEDFLDREPTVTGHPIFDRLSKGFLEDMVAGLAGHGRAPVAFYLPQFNRFGGEVSTQATVEIAPGGLSLVQGPGTADPSARAMEAAREGRRAEAASLAAHRGLFDDPWHLLRVVAGLALLLVVPGILAMGWFELRDFPSRLALVPAISLAMVVTAAILVVAVHRGPFGATDGWVSVAIATIAGAGLGYLGRHRRTIEGRAVDRRMDRLSV